MCRRSSVPFRSAATDREGPVADLCGHVGPKCFTQRRSNTASSVSSTAWARALDHASPDPRSRGRAYRIQVRISHGAHPVLRLSGRGDFG
jgi:hypothetical protein